MKENVLIGHSLGGLFLLRLLEQLQTPVRAAFFVATPVGVGGVKNHAADEAFAGGLVFDWKKIHMQAQYFSVYQ